MPHVTPVIGRFAPSPSGPLHFGSLLAALASFMEARVRQGRWLIRIEDIDTPRVVPGAADAILRTLEAHGLHWDDVVVYQSRRLSHYQSALEQLDAAGVLYPCTCSRRELARWFGSGATERVYPGFCRSGPRRPERSAALRVRADAVVIGFTDRLQGSLSWSLETEIGDFVVRRADGLIAYQLAVVVDDADYGVNQIVRGSDLLDSTPRQIHLQRLLQRPTPEYLHIPVAIDPTGAKLSKQTGAMALDDALPGRALSAALRFLGQSPPADLVRAPVAEIIDWALTHWRSDSIPARLTAPLP